MTNAEAINEVEKLRTEVEYSFRECRDMARASGPNGWKDMLTIDQRFNRRLTALAKALDALVLVEETVR